jgi:hypothetical protein
VIDSAALLKDLKVQLKLLQADLRERADDTTDTWGARLREEYAEARRRERTGHSWVDWRDNEVDQASVAWLLATTFLRFCEDNDLLAGAQLEGRPTPIGWIAGPGDRTQRTEENLTAYFRANPTHNRRYWLQQGFRVLAAQPAGKALVDPKHNPVWTALISPESAAAVIDFWRRTNGTGALVHDFTDRDLDTRFLGDLYQELSEHAKKTYALLQTPVFVEEFILDQTLTPALKEFGLEGLKLIDPTCGSGHFLLGAFERLEERWREEAPALDAKERVRRAMDSIYGVDLNPFAVAIARFRLTVAGLKVAGERSLVGIPALNFHLTIGDSLLGEFGGAPEPLDLCDECEKKGTYIYNAEDLKDYTGILQPGQYHVVVGNPPYITVKDPALNALYKRAYKTAYREYQLTAPFMELFFRLAIRGDQARGAGYVGQITANGFMKQDFGRKVIEDLFGGHHLSNPVDLTGVFNTTGAHIPGHGTPTVILIGRRRQPASLTVRAVLSVNTEPKVPIDPSTGPVWTEIVEHYKEVGYIGKFISVIDVDRATLATFPCPLADTISSSILEQMSTVSNDSLADLVEVFGYTGQTNSDGAFLAPMPALIRRGVESALCRQFVTGEDVRDYRVSPEKSAIFPYQDGGLADIQSFGGLFRWMWPLRTSTWARATFSKRTYRAEGRAWWEWHQVSLNRLGGWAITYPMLATLQHFTLVRESPVFNRHASFLQLSPGAGEQRHLELLGVLNSSTATFWLKQVSHNKGRPSADGAGADEPWEHRYEFTGTKLKDFPLPSILPAERGRILDMLARQLDESAPQTVIVSWLEEASGDLGQRLKEAEAAFARLRRRMVFEQEELDWDVYRLYGLIDSDLTYRANPIDFGIGPSERAFAIALARDVNGGHIDTSWFVHWNHRYPKIAEVPADWPTEYADLVRRRLELIEADPSIRLLEKTEFKRRWASTPWADHLTVALESAILDRLEQSALWRDEQGPTTRSVAELADLLRADSVLREFVAVLAGNAEPDLAVVLGSLVAEAAVPYLAVHRYKSSGLEKFRVWQEVWTRQRREDAGENCDIAVPPKYGEADFRRNAYWKARGKLDVPKERFILYPDLRRAGDQTPVLGWAGWDHRDQALALGRELPVQEMLGADNDALTLLIAGLVELEPWLHQWHHEDDPTFGASPAAVISQLIDQYLLRMEKTREQATASEPPAPTRGRRPKRS